MEKKITLMDGATGTRLWALAEAAGYGRAPVWTYNLTHPELVRRVAEEYIAAGSKLLCANTFAANAVEAARERGVEMRVGNLLASDTFYSAPGCGKNDEWKRMGVLAVEMESAALYANAAIAGKRALCICTISDHIYRPEDNLSAEERQNSFTQMMEIALDTAARMAAL